MIIMSLVTNQPVGLTPIAMTPKIVSKAFMNTKNEDRQCFQLVLTQQEISQTANS